jgi:hypothetical protein
LTPLFLAFILAFFIASTLTMTEGPVESIQASIVISALETNSRIALVAFSIP